MSDPLSDPSVSPWHTVPGQPGRLTREPAATEDPAVTELWRRCEVADGRVAGLRQLLAQGRAVTDADLARVQALIRGER